MITTFSPQLLAKISRNLLGLTLVVVSHLIKLQIENLSDYLNLRLLEVAQWLSGVQLNQR